MKHECRSCKFFGPECFGGYARCQRLQVVQNTGVLMVLDESHPDMSGVKHLSVHVTFGCVLWEESETEEAPECHMKTMAISSSAHLDVEGYGLSRPINDPGQPADLTLDLRCGDARTSITLRVFQEDAERLMRTKVILQEANDKLQVLYGKRG